MSTRPRISLSMRAGATACLLTVTATAATLLSYSWVGDLFITGIVAFAATLPLVFVVTRYANQLASLMRALAGTVHSYRAGEFSFSFVWHRNDEVGDVVIAHNALSDALREQRDVLVQRELLLDAMVQNSPVATFLCDSSRRVVYANVPARHLLRGGGRLEGIALGELLAGAANPLRDAIERGRDGLFTVDGNGDPETYYLARSDFRLNGRPHELYVIRQVSYEFHREEVRTWKRVIRVISHELNNSLAPMASVAHSGAELLRRGEYGRLETVFATIADRVRRIDEFIQGYARFAKLPAPRLEQHSWAEFVERLRAQFEFRLEEPLLAKEGYFDRSQLEQAIINLLRNALESGSQPESVQLHIRSLPNAVAIEVSDRGPGMSETVLSHALLPFYSTKRGGSGLGLALVREIAEAHHGRVSLANRKDGGLTVTITLPQLDAPPMLGGHHDDQPY